jgi:hypothetical protein
MEKTEIRGIKEMTGTREIKETLGIATLNP